MLQSKQVLPIALIGCIFFGSAAPGVADTPVGSMEGLSIALPDGFECSANVSVTLSADQARPFADPSLMSRVAAQLSALMAFDCSEAENIRMEGYVADELVYRAVTSKGSDWSVLAMLQPEAQDEAEVPIENSTESATGGGLLPSLPSTQDDASDEASQAATAPARVPVTTQQDSASALDRLSGIGSSPAPSLANYCSASNFDGSRYSRSRILSGIFSGNFEDLERMDQYHLSVYLISLNEYFRQIMLWQPECAEFYDPDLGGDFIGGVMGGMTGTPEDTANAGIWALGEIGRLAEDPSSFMQRAARLDGMKKAATADGAKLRSAYACSAPEFKRLYENLKAYVRGGDPVCASGWTGLRLSCAGYAIRAGASEAEARERCRCMADAFKATNMDEQTSDWLRLNYDHSDNFSKVLSRFPEARKPIGQCLLTNARRPQQ